MTAVTEPTTAPHHHEPTVTADPRPAGGGRNEARRTTVTIGVFVVGMVMVFGTAFGLGRAVGPVGGRGEGQPSDQQHHSDSTIPSHRDSEHGDGS